jgi:Cohesin domain
VKKQYIQDKLFLVVLFSITIISVLFAGCSSDVSAGGHQPELTLYGPDSSLQTTDTTTTPTNVQASPGDVTVSVSLDQQNIAPGDNFTVNIILNSDIPSRGAQCTFGFDPSAVMCDKAVEGGFYETWANNNSCQTMTFPSEPVIDNTAGMVVAVGVAVMGEDSGMQKTGIPGGATGDGILYSFQMTAKSGVSRTVKFTLSNVLVTSSEGLEIDGVTVNNGSVIIGH